MVNPLPINAPRRDTTAWRLQVWISFGIAASLCAIGLAWLPGNDIDPPPSYTPPEPAPDANARIDSGAQAAVQTYQDAPMPPPDVAPSATPGGLPAVEARLARLETTMQAWVEGQMTGMQR